MDASSESSPHIGGESFCLTYGDGVSDVNIRELIALSPQAEDLCYLDCRATAGTLRSFRAGEGANCISSFGEKPSGDGAWINGGFFVLEPQIFDYIDGDETVWELEPMEHLARDGQLSAFRHPGSGGPWIRCGTRSCWRKCGQANEAPWKIWERQKIGVRARSIRQGVPAVIITRSDMTTYDYAVIGGGIVGLSTAMHLRQRYPEARIAAAGKRSIAGAAPNRPKLRRHPFRHLLQAGQLQSEVCCCGRKFDGEFCRENGIPYEVCGKVIVATQEKELAGLETSFSARPAKWFAGQQNLAAGGK